MTLAQICLEFSSLNKGATIQLRGGGGWFLNWTNDLFHLLCAIIYLFHTLPQAKYLFHFTIFSPVCKAGSQVSK